MAGPASTLTAIVVTSNRLAQIRQTVPRLLDEGVDRLIVIDNASSDGTQAYLSGLSDPRLDAVFSAENLGGAGGFELGLRRVMAAPGAPRDWIVLMDDDARPVPGALAAFRAADWSGWDGVAAAVFHPDGRICEMNRPWLNPFWHPGVLLRTLLGGGRVAFHLKDADFSAPRPVPIDGGSFVGLFLTRDAVQRAGFPDGRLFIYGDDVLYTLGLTARGGRICFAPDLHFHHDFKTLTDGAQRFRPVWKSYYHHRNLLFVYHRAAGLFFWPALLVILPKWLMKARHQGEDRAEYLRLLRRAVIDGLTGRMGRIEGH